VVRGLSHLWPLSVPIHAVWKKSDVAEEPTASIFRVEEYNSEALLFIKNRVIQDDTVQSGSTPTLRRNLLPPSSGWKNKPSGHQESSTANRPSYLVSVLHLYQTTRCHNPDGRYCWYPMNWRWDPECHRRYRDWAAGQTTGESGFDFRQGQCSVLPQRPDLPRACPGSFPVDTWDSSP
jgi:hypothetical protein